MNWMTMRQFLRGGYRDLRGPTVVSIHGRPAFTVFPTDEARPLQLNGVVRDTDGLSLLDETQEQKGLPPDQ
jgi:hypothetical protein